jgi:hypothetical protein
MVRSFVASLALCLAVCFSFTGCTEQERARSFGGATSLDLPQGERLVVVTWKESNLWYLTRPMREGETPETYIFRESSSYGAMEGTITIRERARQ